MGHPSAFALPITNGLVEICEANWRDLGALRSLEKVCFPKDAWPLWDLIGVLTLPNVVRLKASTEEDMVGFIAGDEQRSQDLAWIATLGVKPQYRRQGIASALLRLCEARLSATTIRLSVRRSNDAAIQLYQHAGYMPTGIWEAYYQDGEDALVMEKRRART